MQSQYIIGNYQVDLITRRVYLDNKAINVRPKSFELLQLFLESPNRIISKETILASIWGDVSVDEQIIFQSIKELRKAFSTIDAIKTYPRKGYSWAAEVKCITKGIDEKNESKEINQASKITAIKPLPVTNERDRHKHRFYAFGLALLLLIVVGLYSFPFLNTKANKIEGSIVVLPVIEQLNDRDHKWVRIGAMDQLIQQIPASNDYAVMQVDDVLEIMKRIDAPLDAFNSDDIEKIFVVSGASLIIETELSGVPGDYQLLYTLRQPQNINRGVLITSDVYESIDQLADIVAKQLGRKAATATTYHNQIAGQLLAQALNKKNTEDYLSAESYLKSLIEIEPDNIKAKRLLAEISVYLKKTEQITHLVQTTQKSVAQQQQREFGRLKFWQGLNSLQFGNYEQAKQIFEEAQRIMSEAQDWLYLGYLAEARGHLNRSLKKYELASEYYQQAINNHQIIKCPFGEVSNRLHLADLASKQNNLDEAKSMINNALKMAIKHELTTLVKRGNELLLTQEVKD